MKKIVIVILLLLIVGSVATAIYMEGTLPVNKLDGKKTIFVVKQGESLNEITNNLKNKNFIRNKLIFYIIVKQMKLDRQIQAGSFMLSPSMDAKTIAQTLTHGTLDKWITLLEGWRKEEVAEEVVKNFNIKEAEFLAQADEGYLFPDTYLVPTEANAQKILDILKTNFDKKLTPEIRSGIAKNGLNLKEAVILASLIEREGRSANAKKEIAGILIKRLKNDWPLNIDATIQYALGYQKSENSWWKKSLTIADLKIESLYNTYNHKGLPPGPICSAGLASFKAIAEADPTTKYWFYLTGNDNKMHYSETLEEHNQNVEKFLR